MSIKTGNAHNKAILNKLPKFLKYNFKLFEITLLNCLKLLYEQKSADLTKSKSFTPSFIDSILETLTLSLMNDLLQNILIFLLVLLRYCF